MTFTRQLCAVLMLVALSATRAQAVGWDEDDFIVSSGLQGIAVFDRDWTFKGYVDDGGGPTGSFSLASGLDFDPDGNLIAAWGGNSTSTEVRVYQQNNGNLTGGFDTNVRSTTDLKVGANGSFFAATDDGVFEFTPQGNFLQTVPGTTSQCCLGLVALPNGEVWASTRTNDRNSDGRVFAYNDNDSGVGSPDSPPSHRRIAIDFSFLESNTEPVDARDLVRHHYRSYSLTYLAGSNTVIGAANQRFITGQFTFEVWEMEAEPRFGLLGGHYQRLVNRYVPAGDALDLRDPVGVAKTLDGEVFAMDFSGNIAHWASNGEYQGVITPLNANDEPFDGVFNILWTGNSPQYVVPEPHSFMLGVAAIILGLCLWPQHSCS